MDSSAPIPIGRRSARALRWLAVAAWMVVVFYASSLPGSSVPGRFSVIGHFAEYVVLGGLIAFAVERGPINPRAALIVLVACAVYAATDEVHQAFVPGRVPDPADWAVDALGAATGIAAVVAIAGRRMRASCPDGT